MFANICVLSINNFSKDFFTYNIPPNLSVIIKPGMLVKIPFGPKLLEGFVLDLTTTSTYQTKNIAQVVRPFPVLTSQQLNLALWLAKFYFSPLPLVMRYFRLDSYPKELSVPKSNPQKLFLTPTPNHDLTDLNIAKDQLIYSQKLSVLDKKEIWSGVHSSKLTTIIGTRSALFLPFANLTEITVYEADNPFHFEKQAPNFETLVVASQLAKQFNAKLNITYSNDFSAELAERRSLDYPPYNQLFSLNPIKPSKKDTIVVNQYYLSIKEAVAKSGTDIEVFNIVKNKIPYIFVKGTNLRPLLKDLPKGWRVRVLHLNYDL